MILLLAQTAQTPIITRAEGSVSVPVRGTGKATVAYYIDGVKSGERTIQF